MVYHVPKAGSSTTYKIIFISFISKWCLYALMCYALFGAKDSSPAARYSEWIMLSMALPAALVAALQFRRIRKNTASYADTFYTLTEGGLLIEDGNGQASAFISWSEITEARRTLKHTIYLQRKNGKSLNALLEGLPEERIAEFAAYAAAHAGSTPSPAELTPPPTELTSSPPLLFSATAEQCRELADTRALLANTPKMWSRTLPLFTILWGFFFLYYAAKAEYLILAIIAFFIWKYAARIWRPGGSAAQLSHMQPTHLHAVDNQLLLTLPRSNSWYLNRQASPNANYILPHGICVQDNNNLFMIDPGQPLPSRLQAPCRQVPKTLPRSIIATLLGAILIGALYCFTLSNTWLLHRVLSQDSPDIPAALSLVCLPSSTQVTDVTAYYTDEDVNILLHKNPANYRCAAILYIELANGKVVCAGFDRYAKLIFREIQSRQCDADAAECEGDSAEDALSP